MNIGRVRLTEEYLLALLQFEGGHIVDCQMEAEVITDDGHTFPALITLTIGHPDMPEIVEGDPISDVYEDMTSETAPECGHVVRLTRVDPPKQSRGPEDEWRLPGPGEKS